MPAPGQRSITVNESFYNHLKKEAQKTGESIAERLEFLDKFFHKKNGNKEVPAS